MQTRLTVEQGDITIDDMPFDNIADSQSLRNSISVTKLQEFLQRVPRDKVGPRMHVRTIADRLPQHLDVMTRHPLRVGQNLRHPLRHRDLVDAQIGIWRNNGTTRKVDTLAGQVPSKAALLSL